jgi:4'-phosphopantetheinyl transferase EntD
LSIFSGNIILNRDAGAFFASFCLIKKDLPALIKDLSMLHPKEYAYFNTLKFDARRSSYLLGRYAAKQAVLGSSEITAMPALLIDIGIFQFPVVKGSGRDNIQVCISHCDNIGLAVAFPEEHPLGIDLEKIAAEEEANTIKSYLTERECTLLKACNCPDSIGYTMLWTVKEAMSKVFKTGLTMDLKLLEIDTVEKIDKTYHTTFSNLAQYKAISCQSGEYICSIILPRLTKPELTMFWNSFKQACT